MKNIIEIIKQEIKNILSEQPIVQDDYYLYFGPNDEKNRGFCAALVGKVVTKRKLNQMQNKDGNNPVEWLGGYGCRHKLVQVSWEYIQKNKIPFASDSDYKKAMRN